MPSHLVKKRTGSTEAAKVPPSSKRRLLFDDVQAQRRQADPLPSRATAATAAAVATVAIHSPTSGRDRRLIGDETVGGASATSSAPALVTPGDEAAGGEEGYVPTYIHRNVGYARRGEAVMSETKLRVYKWVVDRFAVPDDFERSRSYGPLSGTCWEERVVQAYALGDLVSYPEKKSEALMGICTECATVGHSRDDCPTLI